MLTRAEEGDIGKAALGFMDLGKIYSAYPSRPQMQKMGEVTGLKALHEGP